MKNIITCLMCVSLGMGLTNARQTQLSLLPDPNTLTDGDAYLLFEKAGKLLPDEAIKSIGGNGLT